MPFESVSKIEALINQLHLNWILPTDFAGDSTVQPRYFVGWYGCMTQILRTFGSPDAQELEGSLAFGWGWCLVMCKWNWRDDFIYASMVQAKWMQLQLDFASKFPIVLAGFWCRVCFWTKFKGDCYCYMLKTAHYLEKKMLRLRQQCCRWRLSSALWYLAGFGYDMISVFWGVRT